MKQITLNGKKGFEKLSIFPFNRDFKVRKELVDSMNKYGFEGAILLIKTDLITGVDELYIADGQNRAVTAAYLDISFYANISNCEFKDKTELVHYIASRNSTQRKWTNADYVHTYTYLGYPEYITLNRYVRNCPYTLNTVASMLTGFRSKGECPRVIMAGTFVAHLTKELDYSLSVAAKASEFGRLSNRMMRALHYVASLKTFDETKFLKEYKKQYKCIKELKLDDFTDIFTSWIK